MSNRLVKNGMGLVVPDEAEEILVLTVTRGVGVTLKSPLPLNEVCKLLQNISTDMMFNSFQKVEPSRLHTV